MYLNKVETFHINSKFEEMYDLFKIERNGTYFLFSVSPDFDNFIESVVYKGHTVYVLTKKDAVTSEKLKSYFVDGQLKSLEKISRRQIDDDSVLLNLILCKVCKEEHFCKPSDLNGRYLKIVKDYKKKGCKKVIQNGLSVSFVRKRDTGEILMAANLESFMKIGDKNISEKDYLTTPYQGIMKHIPFETVQNRDILYRKEQFSGKRDTFQSYSIKSFDGDSKIDIMGHVYRLILSEPYLDELEFSNLNMKKLDKYSVPNLCNDFKKMKEYYKHYFKNHQLYVVRHDLDVDEVEIKKVLAEIDFSVVDSIREDGLNLRILDSIVRGEDDVSDELYDLDMKSGCVVQHIGVQHLKKEPLITCLRELIIKQDIIDGKISSFDFGQFENSEIDEISFIKCYNLNEKLYYCMTINIKTGEIVKTEVLRENEINKLDSFFASLEERDIGGIISSNGQKLILKDTYYNSMPNYDEYLPMLDSILQRNDFYLDSSFVVDFIFEYDGGSQRSILDDNEELIQLLNKERCLVIDVKKVLGHKSKLMIAMSKKIKDEYGVSVIANMKDAETINRCFPYLNGVNYCTNFYTTANEFSTPKEQANNIKLKEIEYGVGTDVAFFESLTPMFFVPFVRNNMLCAAPFPFKYLDEIYRKDLNNGD